MEVARRELDEATIVKIAAHEIGNALTPIGIQVEILRDECRGPRTQRALDILEGALRRCERQLASLADMEVAFGSQPVLRPRLIDLGALVRENLGVFSDLLERRGIETVVEIGDGPWVLADVERLHQVLHNLLINVWRHAPRGGAVACTVVGATVRIENTGPPLSSQTQVHLFDVAHAGSTRGIGLAISQAIMEAHGGCIVSMPGPRWGGPCFEARLPPERMLGSLRSATSSAERTA